MEKSGSDACYNLHQRSWIVNVSRSMRDHLFELSLGFIVATCLVERNSAPI